MVGRAVLGEPQIEWDDDSRWSFHKILLRAKILHYFA
jgi:hypothetical protein